MDLGIKGRVAMVLGAGGGLGGGIAAALAREGATVAACDINADALEMLVQNRQNGDGIVAPVTLDLSKYASLDDAVKLITTDLGRISILVNMTGGPPPTPVTGVPVETWTELFESMVTSVIYLTDLVLPAMREAGWGRVITSTSSGVISPIAHLGLSNALRSSLVGWSKTLANEVARDGITVNVVAPGRVGTDRILALDRARAGREGRPLDEIAAASASSIPVGRYGRIEEYGDVVAFLASERASFINGSIIRVDGGMITSI